MLTNNAGIHSVLCCQLLNTRHTTFYIVCQQKKNNCKDFKDNRILRINIYFVILYQMYTPLSLSEVCIPPPLFYTWETRRHIFFPFFCCGLFPHSIFIKLKSSKHNSIKNITNKCKGYKN